MIAPDTNPTPATPPAKATWFDPQWRDFHKLWSMRIAFLIMIFSASEMAVPAFINWLPPRLFALLCFTLVIGLGIARLVNQKNTSL